MLLLFLLFSACVCNAQSMTDTTAMSMVVMTDSIVQDNTQTMEMSPQLQKVLRSTTYKRRARNERLIGGLCLGFGTVSYFASKFVRWIAAHDSNTDNSDYKLIDA